MRQPVLVERKASQRQKLVLCQCRSWCTKIKPEGEYVPRSTRDNHTRADRVLEAEEKASAPSSRWRLPLHFKRKPPSPPSTSAQTTRLDETHAQINRIEAEIVWHTELPVTNPTQPLAFVNDPVTIIEYSRPSINEFLQPNCGVHALVEGSVVNAPFLTTEYRLCELASVVQTMPESDKTLSVLQRIYKELTRLNYQKEMNWMQQRAHLTPHKVIVNTGTVRLPRFKREIFMIKF